MVTMVRKYFLTIALQSSYQIQVNGCVRVDKTMKADNMLPITTTVSEDLEYNIFSKTIK